MVSLYTPPQLKNKKLTGKENYMYWATCWYNYLDISSERDSLSYNHNPLLLSHMLDTIEPQAMSQLNTYKLTSASLWHALEDLFGPAPPKKENIKTNKIAAQKFR